MCVSVCVRSPTWTLWAVSILRGMAAAFRWACFRLISLTSRQAIWDTEMCYQRATLMACSDTSLHARCISDTSPYLPRVQSRPATSHKVESVKEKGSVKNKMMSLHLNRSIGGDGYDVHVIGDRLNGPSL